MPWYFPWSDSIKKRACRYLLQHYLGHFLQEKLTLEQLTVDLYNGTGRVENVPLDVWSVNEMLDSCGVPFEIIDGYIKTISVSVPWSSLLNESCCMDIQGLEITIAMRQRSETGSLTDSMIFNTMTTSMQLAQECLKQGPSPGEEQAEATTQHFEGLESFAQTIESVLSRVKLSFSDTVIRLEHLPKETKSGIGIEIHIKRIDYSDLSTEMAEQDSQYKAKSVYESAAFAFKNLKIFGVSAYLDEFHEAARTMPPGFGPDSPGSSPPSPSSGMSSPPLSPCFDGRADQFGKSHESSLLPSIHIGSFSGHLEAKLKLKQNVAVTGPKVDIECFFGTLNVFLAPRQVHLLVEVASALSLTGDTCGTSTNVKGGIAANKPMQPGDYRRIEEDLQNQLHAKRQHKVAPGHHTVDSWNFNFDSPNNIENASHLSSETDYDSVLGNDSDDNFYSMPSSGQWNSGQDILPPLEEPQLPADMIGTNRHHVLPHGFGNITKFNTPGLSLTEAAGNVFANVQSTGVQGLALSLGKPHLSSKPLSPMNSGLAGIAALDDPSPEAMHLKLKFSSVAITLMHVDPVLSPVSDTEDQLPDNLDNMSSHPLLQMAEKFFGGLGTYGFGGKDFEDMKERLAEACPNDHLRCMLSPLNIDFDKSATSSYQTISSDISVGRMEVLEYLYERCSSDTLISPALYSTTQLLNFQSRDEIKSPFFGLAAFNSSPCLRAKYKNTQRTCSPGGIQARNAVLPKTELSLDIGRLCSEIDITIIDRLAELLSPRSPFATQSSATHSRMFKSLNPTSFNQHAVFTQAMDEGPLSDQRLNVALTCPELIVMLRFPIPDLRPVVERRPWWKQAIRDESLLLEFSSLEFKTVFCSADPSSSFEFQFRELAGFFKTHEDATPIPLLRSSTMAPDNEIRNGGFDWPRIVITIQPAASLSVLEEEESSNDSPLSSVEVYPIMKSEPSPFSSKPVMYEAEELVLPGNQEEMSKFQEDTVSSCQVHIECVSPRLDVNLHEKELFEMIYNRIASDLLLWEPTAPSPVDRSDTHSGNIGSAGLDLASQLLQGPDKFVMCRSGLHNYAESSSDEEESSNFTSPDHKNTRRGVHENNGQTMLAVTLNVCSGRLAIFPVSQAIGSKSNVSSGDWEEQDNQVFGQIMGEFEDLTFFVAACYKGQVDLSYICLYSKQVSVKHAPLVHGDVHKSMATAFSGAELQSTLYPTERGLKQNSGNTDEPMLSMAAKFSLDPVKNIKEIVLALGIRDTTMRHRIVPSCQRWISQLSEYLDVQDDTVLGFAMPSVVTVLHAHVWQGAVDYRPIHLPLRVLLTMDSFSVSSNLALESSVSLLRFIIDDAIMYISDKCSGQSKLNNYVCVMELGLFELSLLTRDGSDKRHPKIELRMSSNTLHVRTCSDSCSALLQLVQYIAADGDLVPSYETEDQDTLNSPPTPSRCADPPVEQTSMDEREMSSLMLEAMDDELNDENDKAKDEKVDTPSHLLARSPKREIFLFPDDKTELRDEVTECVEALDIDESLSQEDELESDEEFCILDHPDREPEGLTDDVVIKSLLQDDIQIVDNHFPITIGRSDQLSAPDHYPPAVFRYCLREMSLVWQMYGGRDLGKHTDDNDKKRITFASDVGSPAKTVTGNLKPTAAVKSRGGMGRQTNILMELHLNKIRFQFEEYPEDTEQASRLVFLAHEVEVRDRLANSQINKFLYQYTSESRPKQTHANMVMIKMLFMRPDPDLQAQECCLRVSIQPLRLNVDQDALFFLRDFFAEISGEVSKTSKGSSSVESSPIKAAIPLDKPSLNSSPDLLPEELMYVSQETGDESCNSPQAPTFFRSFIFSPEVPIRLDYQGKHVAMDQGTFAGLLIGLAQLNCSELTLKRLCCRNGLLGFDRVINYALTEWLNDIKRTQLPSILGGVGPVHSFVQLFQGMVDLVWMPIEQYRRDGRVMRGLQRGASSFTTSSAMAFLELTNRAVHLVQTAAETAYDMVSPGPSVSPSKRGRHRLAHQPIDLREGVSNAYHLVAKGLNRTAANIVKVAKDEHEQKGMTGAVGGVLRQVPATIVQPFILATEATSNVIGGVRNQILPDVRREATEKWRADPEQ